MIDSNPDIQKIKKDIRRLEEMKANGSMPADLADVSISALEKQLAAYSAKPEGDGAIAQGTGAKAVGKDGILIEGNVYMGPEPENPEEALAIYRRVLANQTNSLPLRGVDVGASDPGSSQAQIGLVNVYVDLVTRTRIEMEEEDIDKLDEEQLFAGKKVLRPLSSLDAVIQNRHMVLLGDPGSGKSTFVNVLANVLCNQALYPDGNWLEHLPGWPDEDKTLVPILVVLRDFARGLPNLLPEQAEPEHLWNFIQRRLEAQKVNKVLEPLQDLLEQGKCILLLDGLDEVPGQVQRQFVRDAVRVFLQRYPDNRALITCRVLSYQEPQEKDQPDLRLTELKDFEIAHLDDKKISRFVEGWYAELGRLGTLPLEEVPIMIGRLQEAVKRPDLKRLAPNPLLLTVMALVHTHKGRLPDARALLYEETVDILLWRWEQIKVGGGEDTSRLRRLLLEAGRTDVDLKRILWELAYDSHAGSEADDDEALADIGELRLQKALASLNKNDLNWAQQIIETIKLRAGLLIERVPEVYTFPHRTFQEYLAGAHLATKSNFASTAFDLAKDGALWRDVILLATGKLVYLSGDVDKPLALVGELCPSNQVDDPLAWGNAWLAGDVLQEIGLNRVMDTNLGRDLLERVQKRLVQIIQGGKLTVQQRVRAGATLGVLGDPRPEVLDLLAMQFCFVPKGTFIFGGYKNPFFPDESVSKREIELPDYWIGKYPVTNAQFNQFVEAGGYGQENLWVEAIDNGSWEDGAYESGWDEDDEPRAHPFDFGEPFVLDNHPVVGVSWYEALAFTRWMDAYLKEHVKEMQDTAATESDRKLWNGLASGNLNITLPTEEEWEKAARGTDGREYPWGEELDPNLANYDDTGIGTTNAVGCFPGGRSVYGPEDMSGNVEEWTANGTLRGGGFSSGLMLVSCAFRNSRWEDDTDDSIGFRLVVSTRSEV